MAVDLKKSECPDGAGCVCEVYVGGGSRPPKVGDVIWEAVGRRYLGRARTRERHTEKGDIQKERERFLTRGPTKR